MGLEPTSSAWKAEVLAFELHPPRPLYFASSHQANPYLLKNMVEGGGFEPPKAEPSDLQSDPFGHSGTPPRASCVLSLSNSTLSTA